ncbi:MAG: hypothetical protein HZB39_09575 [Planctomycetes bacterium]|nr:hypothetical protein [Planctomycetota bacterium]
MVARCPSCLLALAFASTVAAQVPSTRIRLVAPEPGPDDAALSPALVQAQDPSKPAQPGTAPTVPTPPSPRFASFKQQVFDRRSSATLKAWAATELEVIPPEPAPAEQAAPAGQPAQPPQPVDPSAPPPAPDPAAAAAAATQAAEKQAREQKRLVREIEIVQRDVTLGRWEKVGAWIATLPEPERMNAWEHLVRVLPNTPPEQNQNNGVPSNLREQNRFAFDDLLAVWAAAPKPPERKQIELLAGIARKALDAGHVVEELVRMLRARTQVPADQGGLPQRGAAWLLAALGFDFELDGFLPSLDAAVAANDRDALNLMARRELAAWNQEKQPAHLESAWLVTQAALAIGEVSEDAKAEALRRAVELAPKVKDEFGGAWLAESFTTRPERGMEVIATIGGQSARGFAERMGDPEFRRTGLELQKTAVDALLAAAPERADGWRRSLAILAENWLAEAQHAYEYSTSSSRGPLMRRDSFGNIYWVDTGGYQRTPVQPIEPGKLLELAPGGRWLELLDDALKPRFSTVVAKLWLKVNEEEKAFPYIEQFAATLPRNAKELAAEFLRVWIKNHNPNAAQQNTDAYMFMYGFDQRSAGIPLTRSQQERNLKDLARWVTRLRALPGEIVDSRQLAQAFTAAHSTAEVYRIESIESVFGKLDAQEPAMLASLVQGMRANLGNVWRKPSTQEDKKTNRRQKDIEREVMRGYAVAREVVETALKGGKDGAKGGAEDWSLVLAHAAVLHDENGFRQEVEKDTGFAARRTEAMERFARAAELYANKAPSLALDEESTEPFEIWFYAALGASDLPAVSQDTQLDERQLVKIQRAIEGLGGDRKERHLSRFANLLFNRMSAVNPAVKSRYLEGGFAIVGDHPQAGEARKVWSYYKDLVTEIRLVAEIDGDATVGTKPFGVRVNLVHTKDIEREAGGFAKYLQNQTNQYYAYNYGRPLENYRDKFQEAAQKALQEQFEVMSVTFNAADVNSKATAEYGWRVTPYVYILLRARGPQVDKLPQLRFDLDFLDTSGYAVLPIVSAYVPIDASKEPGEARPYRDLEITQILDERQSKTGKLVLEIKAQGKGLVPDLGEILDVQPADFEITSTDDPGVAVSSFDDDREQIVSERRWTIAMAAKADLPERPETFRFASAKDGSAKLTRQRCVDADLIEAAELVTLGERYGEPAFPWLTVALPLAIVVLGASTWWFVRRRGPHVVALGRRLPARLTPFTVLGLLRDIAGSESLDQRSRTELGEVIARIEAFYFARPDGAEPDLRRIAEDWLTRAG